MTKRKPPERKPAPRCPIARGKEHCDKYWGHGGRHSFNDPPPRVKGRRRAPKALVEPQVKIAYDSSQFEAQMGKLDDSWPQHDAMGNHPELQAPDEEALGEILQPPGVRTSRPWDWAVLGVLLLIVAAALFLGALLEWLLS